ncbi:MAG TPA: murein L,D-transpeptidase family protein [Roseiarcus sp.]|nr:murein L,D-transpeptidase family protein [Roseiarcus sp.]
MNLSFWRLAALGLTVAAGALLTGCDDSYLDTGPGRSEHPISSATLAQMSKIDTTPSSPVLIRTYKKEAELEIWKMTSEGRYALLKTYPICRWSGQLGPKKVEGDMQVPEGFYTIEPGQLNPNSHYYLAFNVGYPNAYDRAYGRTGGSVMVHGVCSSAGCFSMTDEQVADIYAIARDALRGGQREIQLQSYPFRMTPENMAKYRLDPNIAFWKELKKGSDHFEVAKTEPPVVICGKHYVFGATANDPVSASAPCPALQRDDEVEALVAEKEAKDNAKVAELAASGVKATRTVYADGGQNPVFAGYKDTSDPDALVGGSQEIVLNDAPKLVPAVVKVAATSAGKQRAAAAARTAPVEAAAAESAAQPRQQPVALASTSTGGVAGMWGAGTQNVKKWLHLGGQDQPVQPEVAAYIPDQPIPTEVPLPPRRDVSLAQAEKPPHVAQKAPLPPSKPVETSATQGSTTAAPDTTATIPTTQ